MTARYSPRAPQLPAVRDGAPPPVEVLRLSDDRATIVGRLPDINVLLGRLRAAGRLVRASDPVRDGRHGLYAVQVRLMVTPAWAMPAPAVRRRFWTRGRVVAAVAVGLAVAALAAWLVSAAVAWVAANIVTVLVALAVIAALGKLCGARVCKTVVSVTHWH